jgi:hypothetical protein
MFPPSGESIGMQRRPADTVAAPDVIAPPGYSGRKWRRCDPARGTPRSARGFGHPVVTAPIIGPSTVERLDHSLRALKVKLSAEAIEKLDEIFPRPGGPPPEAYAW